MGHVTHHTPPEPVFSYQTAGSANRDVQRAADSPLAAAGFKVAARWHGSLPGHGPSVKLELGSVNSHRRRSGAEERRVWVLGLLAAQVSQIGTGTSIPCSVCTKYEVEGSPQIRDSQKMPPSLRRRMGPPDPAAPAFSCLDGSSVGASKHARITATRAMPVIIHTQERLGTHPSPGLVAGTYRACVSDHV